MSVAGLASLIPVMNVHDPRLPRHVVPTHYELVLEPNIAEATFAGTVVVSTDISVPTRSIVCNAADLRIAEVVIRSGATEWVPDIDLDHDTERLTLSTPTEIPAGPVEIHASFEGTLNDQLRGFYRSSYTDDDGVEHTIATTQFQSTDARRAFPCWDEPEWKATFSTTLIVGGDDLAVTNTAEVESTVLDDGRRRVRFATTMSMSTYLVAFVVGPLHATEPVDAGGVPVRVVHRPGQGHLTSFALDVAVHALEWFADYYAIPYPSDKVDLIAIPDFAFGAMENLGCVTFREVLLLIDPEGSSQPELQRAADVINHELAHMWFGDLVTMRWWEGIWLNEAFATFMEVACSDAYRPDWRVWDTFARARSAAFDVDALASTRPIEFPVVTPEDAEGMFDLLTYEKGAAVVRMLEQHLGADTFREGVRRYLTDHAYSNTETSDLWDALETESGEPVREMMTGWIFQGGHPLISTEPTPHGERITQRHFTLDPQAADDRLWAVPIRLTTSTTEHNLLLRDASLTLTGVTESVLSPNGTGSGFFRSQIDPSLIDQVVTSGLAGRSPAQRHTLADDAWALTVAGRITASEYLRLAGAFFEEEDLNVWQALGSGLSGLIRIVDDAAAPVLRARIGALVAPALSRLGTEPRSSDDDRAAELRATLLRLMGAVVEDESTIHEARNRLDHTDATISAASLTIVAHNGTASDFDFVRAAWQGAHDPQAESRNLRALADFPSIELIDRVLTDIGDGEVRTQDAPYVIGRALTNRRAGNHVWRYVVANWTDLTDRFPSNSIPRMLAGVVALDDPDSVASVAGFIADHPIPQAGLQVDQHLERQRINAALRHREQPRFASSLVSGEWAT